MAGTTQHVGLSRKVAAGQQATAARTISLAKALRRSIAKVANDLLGLPLAVLAVSEKGLEQDDLVETLPDDMLMVLLDGPDGATGAALLGTDLVLALVQQQTTGKVSRPSTDEPPRKMTDTDAALAAPFLDEMIDRAAKMITDEADLALLSGYRFGARADDARVLGLLLQAPSYHFLRLTLDVARGVCQSDLWLLLPIGDDGAYAPLAETGPAKAEKSGLDQVLPALPAELMGVLCKFSLPLARLNALKTGDLLPMGRDVVKQAGLYIPGGRRICLVEIGQSEGERALRLGAMPMRAEPKALGGEADLQDLPAVEGVAGFEAPAPSSDLPELPSLAGPSDSPAPIPDLPLIDTVSSSDLPDLSDTPDLPDLPDLSDTPDLPDLSDTPDLPDLPDLSEPSDLPDLDASPDLPDLPDLPPIDAVGEEPLASLDLPDLPPLDPVGEGAESLDLPDLPPLPDLPDLPKT